MKQKHTLVLVAVAVILGAVHPASADEADDLFASFYGERYKKVQATRDKADDIELAKDLLAAAEKITDHQGLLALFYEKAYALTHREPAGYALAIRAAATLAEKIPAKQAECREKVLAVRRSQYLRGTAAQKREAAGALIKGHLADAAAHEKQRNITEALAAARKALGVATATRSPARGEVLAEIKRLTARQRVAMRMKGLRMKLAANPADTDTRHELIRMLVIEFDDPAAAVKVLEGATDETLRTYVPLAAGPIDKLAAAVCAELGDWYWSQYPKADTVPAKVVCLGRAQKYIERFLSLEKGKGIQSLKAALALKKVQAELSKLGQAAGDLAPLDLTHRVGPVKGVDLKVKPGQVCFPPKGRLAVAAIDRGIVVWGPPDRKGAAGDRRAVLRQPTGAVAGW